MRTKGKNCIKRIKTMITNLGPGRKLPTITNLISRLGYSYPTVRNSIKILENEGYLENQGSLGFYTAVHDIRSWLNIQKSYLSKARTNLDVAKLLSLGAKLYGKFAILNGATIIAIDIITGKKFTTSDQEIDSVSYNPISLEEVTQTHGKNQRLLMSKFLRYNELRELAQVIYRHK